LSSSTGENSGQLTLEAGGNITFANAAKILDANDWNVSLYAGVTGFLPPGLTTPTIQAGSGNIYLNGGSSSKLSGSIQTAQGSISLEAGGGVYVGTGSILTTAGGNIDVTALSGDIIVGTKPDGNNSGYFGGGGTPWGVASFLGGISTMAGGNVTLDAVAGSINPSTSSSPGFDVSGAFGSEPGNVTLIAGTGIFGTFNVANGTGTMLAGGSLTGGTPTITPNSVANVGSSTQPVTLQLAAGSWNVWAANNIYVSQVLNPAGTFDSADSFPFNYASAAADNFWAGNGITLLGQGLSPIYAPQLSLTAGAGGVTIESPISLFPSKAGSLNILTLAGGDLIGINTVPSVASGITMSDTGSADHSTPATVDVSGSIYNFDLTVPTSAQINVVGNAYNFGFTGENLSTDTHSSESATSIALGLTAKANMETLGLLNPNTDGGLLVGGDLIYPTGQSSSSVALAEPLPAELLNPALTGVAEITPALLAYNASAGTLTANRPLSASEITYLLNPTGSLGKPLLDANNEPVTLDAAQRAAVLALYADGQAANSLALNGPGAFNITAHTISLGVSSGITVDFPNAPAADLDAISPYGANLNITTAGNVDLTVSAIANGGLDGNINLTVGGALDVGGTATALGSASAPKGIFTSSGGNITINAVDNVNVDGSRIAAFNGGNVNVTSQTGDVDAGTGGQGSVVFGSLQIDPLTGQLISVQHTIPFSGIVATTVPGSDATLGNITVNAPEGNVNSSVGGILQIAFNNANTKDNFIDVTAGQDINATGSGVIGYNVNLKATGNITGVVVGSQSVAVTSQQNVDVTVVSGGSADISAAGTVSGTVIGGGSVAVSGSSIDAAIRGGSVSTSGNISGTPAGTPAAPAAPPPPVADNADTASSKTDSGDDDDQKKKKAVTLAQKISRVTVILPGNK
jgi:hypothetical protein